MAPIEIRTLVSCGFSKRKMSFLLATLDFPINLAHIAVIIYDWVDYANEKSLNSKHGKIVSVLLGCLAVMAIFQMILAMGHMYYWKYRVGEKYMLRFWIFCSTNIEAVTGVIIPFLLNYTESALGLAANLVWLIFKFYQLIIMTMYLQGKYITRRYP